MRQEFNINTPFPDGLVIPINKPLGWSSADVVRKIKYRLQHLGHKKIKIGHAGTLDPLASGVLIICIGRATKMADSYQAERKEYLTTITLGATTPSYDMEHPVDATFPHEHITLEALKLALSEMEGEQLQTPPVYSAKLIDGKRAYEYARKGDEVKMRQSLINIYKIDLVEFASPKVSIRIECSKGTYIRSIARDLGEKLKSGGYLSALCRSRSGSFTLEDCYNIEEVEAILTPAE